MHWIRSFLTSTIGQKLVMSLTGLFLILFLVVHLAGNLQLLNDDGGEAFNTYAYFMTHNPLIKTISYGLYAFILIHSIQGIALKIANRKARPKRYNKGGYPTASFASKQMALLGILIFAFLCLHMGDFWYKMKFTDQLAVKSYAGFEYEVKDLYARVDAAFQQSWIVVAYLIGLLALAVHLWHGFDSAFQTLGWNHKKYGFVFKWIGRVYSIIIPAGFAVIPAYYYFMR
ncbi:MAG: succinate dehydrogenase cytochrome b subunit [Saprospiraceae bacterium]|nr:succinate dehydrogenase cytochrome b subunit [Saprospiraceae bacterium]